MMTQGELEKIPLPFLRYMSDLENRIMADLVERLKANREITSTADWQINRLKQLGLSNSYIKQQIKEAAGLNDAEIDKLYGDTVKESYIRNRDLYQKMGKEFIPFEKNRELQELLTAVKEQTAEQMHNITGSLGFAIRGPDGKIMHSPLKKFYQDTLDAAMFDMATGTFDYNAVLNRTIQAMTNSGLRSIDYDSGRSYRVDTAARMCISTGFNQVQAKINEQVAKDLKTDYFEVSWHGGARPSHQVWQGRVYSKSELGSVCGLGSPGGLCGVHCYHSYNAYIPGVSTRVYTDAQLDQMNREENVPKTYKGREYTTYEALQEQRRLERLMRKQRQDIQLTKKGDAEAMALQAKYRGTMDEYVKFSKKMKLSEQRERIFQDGLGKMSGYGIHSSRVPRGRKDSAANLFSVELIEKGDTVSAQNIYKDLNKTDVGKDVIEFIKENKTSVDIYYNQNTINDMHMNDDYGMCVGNHIYINAKNAQNIHKIADTIIHETKHIELGIGGDQHAEAICDYYAMFHRKGPLTGADIRAIIKSVKERYPEYKWRR